MKHTNDMYHCELESLSRKMGAALFKGDLLDSFVSLFSCHRKPKHYQRNRSRSVEYDNMYVKVYEEETALNPSLFQKPVTKISQKSQNESQRNKKKPKVPMNVTFARLRDIKQAEAIIFRKTMAVSPKFEATKIVLKKDMVVKTPTIIDCEYCIDCTLIDKEIRNMINYDKHEYKVQKIVNVYNEACFELRKKELEQTYGNGYVTENLLYHGTSVMNLNSIIRDNFDWRLYGKSHGCVLGKGTAFTFNLNIAECYCSKEEPIKCIVVSKVLVSRVCFGDDKTVFPMKDYSQTKYDSTVDNRKKRNTFIKYRDDEFCPTHVIFFTEKDTEDEDVHSNIEPVRRESIKSESSDSPQITPLL